MRDQRNLENSSRKVWGQRSMGTEYRTEACTGQPEMQRETLMWECSAFSENVIPPVHFGSQSVWDVKSVPFETVILSHIQVNGATDLLHLRNVDTHWSFAWYIPRMQLCNPVMHNPSPLSPAARSNPLRCIIFAWVCITCPHTARPTVHWVIQVPPSLCAMQAMHEGLCCTPTTAQPR